MEQIKEFLVNLANNNDIKHSDIKIEQKERKQLKEELTNLLYDTFSAIACEDFRVVRIDGGVGIACDNEKVGFIPIKLTASFMDFIDKDGNDILALADDYEYKKEQERIRKEQQAQQKATKIAKDNERRAKATAKAKAKQAVSIE